METESESVTTGTAEQPVELDDLYSASTIEPRSRRLVPQLSQNTTMSAVDEEPTECCCLPMPRPTDPYARKKLWASPGFATLWVCLVAALPMADVATDVALLTTWYTAGPLTYVWTSMGVFAVATVASSCVGVVMDRQRGWFVPIGILASVLQLRLTATVALALGEIWGGPRDEYLLVRHVFNGEAYSLATYIALFKLVELWFEAIPQACIQTYALAHGVTPQLWLSVSSLFLSLSSIASGFVGLYLSWDDFGVRVLSMLFVLAMTTARVAAFVALFKVLNTVAIVAPVACAALRLGLLHKFKLVELSLVDFFVLSPILLVLCVVPIGVRVDDLKLERRYEGIKALFAFAGAARCTFRNRLHSDLAIQMILLQFCENMAVLLVVSICQVKIATWIVLVLLGLLPLVIAPAFYFAALRRVELRENGWQESLALPDHHKRSLWRAVERLPNLVASDCKRAQDTCSDAQVVDPADNVNTNIETFTLDMIEGDVADDDSDDTVQTIADTVFLDVVNRPGSSWNNVLAKFDQPHHPSKLIYIPDLLRYCCCNNFPGFTSLDLIFASLDAHVWTDLPDLPSMKGRLGLQAVTADDLPQLRELCIRAIDDDDVRPSLRAALDELAFELYITNTHALPNNLPAIPPVASGDGDGTQKDVIQRFRTTDAPASNSADADSSIYVDV